MGSASVNILEQAMHWQLYHLLVCSLHNSHARELLRTIFIKARPFWKAKLAKLRDPWGLDE